ncbi:hypothetical protein OSTOST_21191, partial [Ostertagia ostertagi]
CFSCGVPFSYGLTQTLHFVGQVASHLALRCSLQVSVVINSSTSTGSITSLFPQTGSPVLGCAQPSCVAHSADDFDDSVFHTDSSGQIDGFFREGDKSQGHLQMNKLRGDGNCSGNFDRLACTRKNQWVGGIEFINHPRQPLLLQCCTFEGLRFSQIVGVTSIRAGEAVTGGEVIRAGRQISFDVIANIRKVIDRDDPR